VASSLPAAASWEWVDAVARLTEGAGRQEVVERGSSGGHSENPQIGAAAGTCCGGVGLHDGPSIAGSG
jgi:hypothetical protein